jgi:hypothetical protein
MVGCKLNNHQWFTRDCEQCFNNLTGEWNRSRTEIARLREQLQSKHDYGPASPGEQQAAWELHCKSQGWEPNKHPTARSQFCEGYVFGDAFSSGDESVGLLRARVAELEDVLLNIAQNCESPAPDPLWTLGMAMAVARTALEKEPKP